MRGLANGCLVALVFWTVVALVALHLAGRI